MRRRDMFRAVLAGTGTFLGLRAAQAAATETPRLKVAYHLSDVDKVNFVLGNIKNHYEGTGGNADIVLVVHGPALASFKSKAFRPRSPAASPAWCSKGSSRKPAATPCGAWIFRLPTCSTASMPPTRVAS